MKQSTKFHGGIRGAHVAKQSRIFEGRFGRMFRNSIESDLMKKERKFLLVGLCSGLWSVLSGCQSYFPLTPNANPANPVIEDKLRSSEEGQIFSLTAARRIVLAQHIENKNRPAGAPLRSSSAFCTEPPPDATDNVAEAMSGAITAAAKGAAANPEVSASVASSLATAAQQLYKRAHGVQFYRDGSHSICQRYLNGQLTSAEAIADHRILLVLSADLIAREIARQPLPTPVASQDTSLDGTFKIMKDVVESVEKERKKRAEEAPLPAAAGATPAPK